MATTTTHLLTAEEFYEWVHRPENEGRFFELDRGEIVEMPVPGKYHGFVCGNIAAVFWNFAKTRKRGYVCTNDAGVIVERDPDTVRGPDVTFYEDDQAADDMERQYAEEPPKLAVDVLSPGDRIGRVMVRIGQLLARGVPLVWVVDPESRDVTVHRSGQQPRLLQTGEEITGEDVLPDFRCRVEEFFTMPGSR